MWSIIALRHPLTAKDDIIVWRIIKKDGTEIECLHHNKKWGEKRIYTREKKFERDIKNNTIWNFIRGFHAYSTKKRAMQIEEMKIIDNEYPEDYLSVERFVIPRGSKYLIEGDEYISDHMMWSPE